MENERLRYSQRESDLGDRCLTEYVTNTEEGMGHTMFESDRSLPTVVNGWLNNLVNAELIGWTSAKAHKRIT